MRCRPTLLALACLALAACSGMPASDCRQPLIQDVLYFGLSTPSGGQITPEQWQGFLREEVTPRFPAGLSVVDAAGQVAQRDVRTGLATEAAVEITTGLEEGDAVIIGDRSRLQIGQHVETKVVTVG